MNLINPGLAGGFNASGVPCGALVKTDNTLETTTIATAGVPVVTNWTTTFKSSDSNLFTMPSNGRLTYGGTRSFRALIICTVSLQPTSGNLFLESLPAKNGTEIDALTQSENYCAGIGHTTSSAVTEITTDDYIELFIGNRASTTNIYTKSGSISVNFLGWT
jgi:hypothetical protein